MSCKIFQQCLQSIATSSVPVGKKTKGRIVRQNSIINCPCNNPNKINKCVSFFDGRSKPECRENGKLYVVDKTGNGFDVLCFHVDGGVLSKTDESPRCDFVMLFNDGVDGSRGRAIFVELKGSNTKKALEQLLYTLQNNPFSKVCNSYSRIYGRIANSSSVPRIKNTGLYMDLESYLIKHGGNLKTGEWRFEEKYSDLDSR